MVDIHTGAFSGMVDYLDLADLILSLFDDDGTRGVIVVSINVVLDKDIQIAGISRLEELLSSDRGQVGSS